ncbi:hypothetical protein ACETIH_05435 [Microvirga arabica]|uniref:Sulphur transport domain-containing protein n=1 Tax=Microvirga arabica TaxID=1128671 RepID=A0ABV6Y4Q8_9HYPH
MVMLFTLGSIAAFVSLLLYRIQLASTGQFSSTGLASTRLVLIGRAGTQILSAGGMAASLFAGFALVAKAQGWSARLILAGLGMIGVTIVLTQSRGPSWQWSCGDRHLHCRNVALAGAEMASGHYIGSAVTLALLCIAILMGSVLLEPSLKTAVCSPEVVLCRLSERQAVWRQPLE